MTPRERREKLRRLRSSTIPMLKQKLALAQAEERYLRLIERAREFGEEPEDES